MLVESFSGIRGIYGEFLTEAVATRYARAFVYFLKTDKKLDKIKLVIGRDSRPSSSALAKAFIDELSKFGCEILDLKLSSTPATENAVRYFKADGGVMITGSHNPPEHNGWKLLRPDGALLAVADAAKVIDYAQAKQDTSEFLNNAGTVIDKSAEAVQAYIELLLKLVGVDGAQSIKAKGFKILFDAGGGAIISNIKSVAENFGIQAVYKNIEPGIFNRPIEPTVKSLQYLGPIAQEQGVEFAVGFDADADRAEIVLPSGEMVSGQYLVALLVDEVLSTVANPEKQIVVLNDASSDLICEVAKKHGASILEVEVGEVNVVDKMQELVSAVGGEGSNGGGIVGSTACRDGLLSALMILRHLARTGKSLPEVITAYPKFYTLNQKAEMSAGYDRDKIEKLFIGQNCIISKTGDNTGGLKIRYPDNAWLWFRGSKTEAGVVRIYAESKNEARAKELLAQGCNLLKK